MIPRITEEQLNRYYDGLVNDAIKNSSKQAYARCGFIISLLVMGYEIPYHDLSQGWIGGLGGIIAFMSCIGILFNKTSPTSEI